jgi:hypothetical protein
MKLFEAEELTEKERTSLGHYFRLNEKLKDFQNGCTNKTFQDLFGEKEGTRLWEFFRGKCDGEMSRFFSYLTDEQKNIFWINLVKYKNLAKQIL